MRPSRARVPRAPVVATALVLVTAAVWHLGTVQRTADVGVVGGPDHPGALALAGGVEFDPDVDPLPPMVSVYEDWLRTDEWGCEPLVDLPIGVCTQPVEDPERRIVIVGDSHVQQLAVSLLPIAESRNWQLIGMLRGACPYSSASEVVPDAPECLAWLDAAAEQIAELQPDAVVTLASRNVRVGLTEVTPPGFVDRWRELDELGIPVIAVRDNPRFDFSPPDCLARGGDPVECGVERTAIYAPDPPWSVYDDIPSNVTFLDLSDQLCDPVHCPAEIGNVLVYMDDNHVTASYATTMAPVVEQRILEGLGW